MGLVRTLLLASAMPALPAAAQEPLKLGIIGLDSSHAPAFADLLNDPSRPNRLPGALIVAAYKGGSPGVPASSTRIEHFTGEITSKYHVRLVPTIEELTRQVDAVLLLSVDARQHLDQVRPVLAAGKPVFIDKPMAGSLSAAREIADLSRRSGTPFLSCSSVRFARPFAELAQDAGIGRVEGALTFGPATIESYLPDLFWYGIHSVEALYKLMGPGCARVARVHTDGEDSVVGTWRDGRIGEIRGLRSSPPTYGAVVFGSRRVAVSGNLAAPDRPVDTGYRALLEEILKFFRSGKPPVAPEETLEVLAFMEAADRSRERNGEPVPLETRK